jgi:hypothetical protein
MIGRRHAGITVSRGTLLAALLIIQPFSPAYAQTALPVGRPMLTAALVATESPAQPPRRMPQIIRSSTRLVAGQAPSQGTRSRGWAREHPTAFWGLIGAAAGFGLGLHASATAECPPGRSCSTEPLIIPPAALLGWGVGSIVGLTIEHWH